MENKSEKQLVLEAIAAGKYEVTYEPVNTIYECTKYDGSTFYVREDLDGPRSSEDMGSITFETEGEENHQFIYNLNGGEWEGDDLCEDEEVTNALEGLGEFISYENYDGDRQWEVYRKAYGIGRDADCYWCEDDDCPRSIESLGDDEVEVPLQYFVSMSHGACSEFMDMDGEMSDEDLYHVYLVAKKAGFLENLEADEVVNFPAKEIESDYPELYKEMMEQVEERAEEDGYDNSEGFLDFVILLSEDLFEDNL